MKNSLSLQQRLQQKLSPQQIQTIKLIEIPGLELKDRIMQEIQENPALEEGEDKTEEDTELDDINKDENEQMPDDINFEELDDYDTQNYKLSTNNHSRDEERDSIPMSTISTFHEHLIDQINMRELTEKESKIAYTVIGNIDDDGYLRRDAESMAYDIEFQTNMEVTADEVNDVIKKVQTLDPAGVCATDLKECLEIQLKRKTAIASNKSLETATRIIEKSFELFSKKHYDEIMKRHGIDEETLKDAIKEIIKLNPKPGASFDNTTSSSDQSITPDFILEIEDGEPIVTLNNSDIPPLRVSEEYKNMLSDYSKNQEKNKNLKDTVMFVKQKIDSAKWFIDAIAQGNRTMLKVMTTIVKLQKEFFIKGEESCLRPLILKNVADITNMDIATVSRVTNSKYIQTEYGIFPLKYFFSSAMQTEDGEEVASKTIKSILKKCVDEEDKKNPIKDEELMEVLNKKGFKIARRTVAKYREQLGIPVARLRKEI